MATVSNGRVVLSRASGTTKLAKTQKAGEHRARRAQRAASLLKQISDPTRLQMIQMLADGERHVGALSGEFNVTQPAVSHHLALLRHSGLIIPRRQGKHNFYALTAIGEKLAKIVDTVME